MSELAAGNDTPDHHEGAGAGLQKSKMSTSRELDVNDGVPKGGELKKKMMMVAAAPQI